MLARRARRKPQRARTRIHRLLFSLCRRTKTGSSTVRSRRRCTPIKSAASTSGDRGADRLRLRNAQPILARHHTRASNSENSTLGRCRAQNGSSARNWENRVDGKYVGGSHLVHEYLAGSDGPLYKLRINFRDPAEFFDAAGYRTSGAVAICARIGDLEHPVNFARMTHFVRDTDYGCEMRSRFWLGIIESRDPNVEFSHL